MLRAAALAMPAALAGAGGAQAQDVANIVMLGVYDTVILEVSDDVTGGCWPDAERSTLIVENEISNAGVAVHRSLEAAPADKRAGAARVSMSALGYKIRDSEHCVIETELVLTGYVNFRPIAREERYDGDMAFFKSKNLMNANRSQAQANIDTAFRNSASNLAMAFMAARTP